MYQRANIQTHLLAGVSKRKCSKVPANTSV
jgi:hypothetical protein